MNTKDIISIHQFCSSYGVPDTFIDELLDYELIELVDFQNEKYIYKNRVKDLERIVHLRYELNINPEGIDVVGNLLNRIAQLENEIKGLRNRLALYE